MSSFTTHQIPSSESRGDPLQAEALAGRLSARRVAVLGAGSCVGRRVVTSLREFGASVIAIRRPGSAPIPDSDMLWLDVRDANAHSVLGECGASIIISVAPLFAVAKTLARVSSPSATRVVACSSMSAEAKRASPSKTDRHIAEILQAAEASVLGGQVPAVVVRPTMIYGHPQTANVAALQRFARKRGWLAVPSGAFGLRQPIHVNDLVDVLLAASVRGAVGKTYDVGGGERVSCIEMAKRVAESESARLFRIPCRQLPWIGRAMCSLGLDRAGGITLRTTLDQCADNQSVTRELGVHPRIFSPCRSEA